MKSSSSAILKERITEYLNEADLEISEEQAAIISESVSSIISENLLRIRSETYGRLVEMISDIASFKNEVVNMFDEQYSPSKDELEVVLKTTEEAVETILQCAEEIDNLAAGLPEKQSIKFHPIVTQIYEASNFQDVNGQRIIKVMRTFKLIEEKLKTLSRNLAKELPEEVKQQTCRDVIELSHMNKNAGCELEGPQNPDCAPTQEEIDRLLAEL